MGSSADGSERGASAAFALRDVSAVHGGRLVWSDGSFEVPRGAFVCIIGPNGSGKTTLLRVLLGLVPPSTGTVEVLGDPVRRGDRRIGYVPQRFTDTVGAAVTGRGLVRLGRTGTRWGLGRSRAVEAAVDEALRSVGAEDFADQRVAAMSGGQQQRIAVAQALVGDPELLLLDEPLANLDLRNQHEIVDLLAAVREERGVTIVSVTHDLHQFLPHLTGAVYLLDGHPHYGSVDDDDDGSLLTHLYGTEIRVVRTAQGDLFTRGG